MTRGIPGAPSLGEAEYRRDGGGGLIQGGRQYGDMSPPDRRFEYAFFVVVFLLGAHRCRRACAVVTSLSGMGEKIRGGAEMRWTSRTDSSAGWLLKRESVTEVVDGEGGVRVSLMKIRTEAVQV